MSTTSANPEVAALARMITELRSRLRAVERHSRLPFSSVTDEDGSTYSVQAGIVGGVTGSAQAAEALAQIVDVQATADSKVTVFYADTAPTEELDNPEFGDQWLVTADSTYQGAAVVKGSLLAYDGDTWTVQQDAADIAAALGAAQNAQDTADGKIETYWQATDPRPGVTPSSGDLWYQLNDRSQVLAVWRWDPAGPAWRNLPLTSGAIAQGGIAPDRLSVGVVSNLVQDPIFSTGVRRPQPGWSILGPDDVYTDSRYLRSENRTAGTVGDPSSDSTYMLTDRVPVQPGRTVRVAAEVRCDAAAVPGGPAPTIARLRVYFYSPTPDAPPLSGTDQIIGNSLADTTGGVYDTWLQLEGTFTVPEGYSAMAVAAQVTNQIDGHVDYIRPEVQVLWSQVQSSDYVEGESGWVLSSDAAQFTNVNVVGDLGAGRISASTIQLDSRDLGDDLNSRSRGVVAFGRSYASANTDPTTGTTRLVTHDLHSGGVQAGRMYKFRAHGWIVGSTPGDLYEMGVNYTTDGGKPLNTSDLLDAALSLTVVPPSGGLASFTVEAIYLPQLDYPSVRFGLSMRRLAGSGSAYVQLTDVSRALEMWVEDWGETDATYLSGNNGQLTIRSGAAADTTDPVQTHTTSWPAVWGRSYAGDGTTRGGPTGDVSMYMGYYDGTDGNQRSLIGFDYGAIQTALSGATVQRVTLTYRVKHTYRNNGIRIYVSSHNYTSRGSRWVASQVVQNRANASSRLDGVTYVQELPVAVGNEFKSGTTRGLGFGPGPSNDRDAYYGYVYGPTESPYEPVLTITYAK